MLEEYMKMVEQICSPDIAAEVRAIDMAQEDSQSATHRISQALLGADKLDCFEAYVGYLAHGVDSRTAPGAIHEFLAAATAVPAERRPALKQAISRAYDQLAPDASNHKMYFNVAGLYLLPLVDEHSAEYSDAGFTDHTDPAMSYHGYLILIGDPKGLDGFNRALDVNNADIAIVFGLVSALSDLAIIMHREGRDVAPILNILKRYVSTAE